MRFPSSALTLVVMAARGARYSSAFVARHCPVGATKRPPPPSATATRCYSVCASSSVVRRPALLSRRSRESAGASWASLAARGGSQRQTALHSSATTTAAATEEREVETAKQPPVEIFRSDYEPLPYTVKTVQMNIDIREGKTVVTTDLVLQSNPEGPSTNELVLDGDETAVKLRSISLDGRELQEGVDYTLGPGRLTLKNVKSGSKVSTVCEIVPEDNTQLSGLYKSDSMYCSQCEAMGFRRITYYPDRPDVMAVFEKVRIEADREHYPLLLSNGNLVDEGAAAEDGRHYAVWSDPFPKPSYLFATVAGSLGGIEDTFTTASGRKVSLRLYSEPNNVDKLYYAMDSLKRSMKWDEDRFGVSMKFSLLLGRPLASGFSFSNECLLPPIV